MPPVPESPDGRRSITVINVAGFENDSITNGPGLRFVVFTQGCPHHCRDCQNPETWEPGVGRNVEPEEIIAAIRRNPLLKGVTFSGGEPIAQAAALLPLAEWIHENNYELAIYTGYSFEELLVSPDPAVAPLLRRADVLVDGRFDRLRKNLLLRFRGSSNQRILDLPASLAARRAIEMPLGRWRAEGR